MQKRWFHFEGLEQLNSLIREMLNVVTPALTMVDGIYCLEGEGPIVFGKPKKVNLLIAGEDVVEVDNTCCQIMGVDVNRVEHIPSRENIEVRGISVKEAKNPFIIPLSASYQVYNVCYQANYACSGCLNATKKAMELFYTHPIKFLKVLLKGKVEVISGRRAALPQNNNYVICIGDCTEKFSQEYNMPHVKGCPPEPKDIFDKFS